MEPDHVRTVLQRLRTYPLPTENAAQVCYQLGWLEALDALGHALDLSAVPSEKSAPTAAQGPRPAA